MNKYITGQAQSVINRINKMNEWAFLNHLPKNKYFHLQFRGKYAWFLCIFLILCAHVCLRSCVSVCATAFPPSDGCRRCFPPAPVPLYSVQAVTQTAVTQVVTSPFTSSPANQGSALMSAWSLRKDARSSRGPGDLVLTRTHARTRGRLRKSCFSCLREGQTFDVEAN